MEEKSTTEHPVSNTLPPVVLYSIYPCDAHQCKSKGKIIKEHIGINYHQVNRYWCAHRVWDRCAEHSLICSEFRSQEAKKYLCTRTCSIEEANDSSNTEKVDGYIQWYCSSEHFDKYHWGRGIENRLDGF